MEALTRFLPSTITRFFARMTFCTVPVRPASLPAITITCTHSSQNQESTTIHSHCPFHSSTRRGENLKTRTEEHPYLVASKNAPLLEHLLRCFVTHSALFRARLWNSKNQDPLKFSTSHPISVTFHHLTLSWRSIQTLEMRICGTCVNASGAHKWKSLSKP